MRERGQRLSAGFGRAGLSRQVNRSAVLSYLRHHSPTSRTQVARGLGISLPTVMRIVSELEEQGLVNELGPGESTGGRPHSLIAFNGSSHCVIGIDLGGSKIFGALADLNGNILVERYHPFASGQDNHYSALCSFLEQLVEAEEAKGRALMGIGIGVPSVVGPGGVVHWAPALGWRDLPLQEMLTERLSLPVVVENDVNLAALGELEFGAGVGARHLVCIAIGTGIGAGIVIDGSIYRGAHQAAGEIGYMLPGLEFLGRSYTGFGALESMASGSGVARRARELLRLGEGEGPSAEAVFASARAGEPWAVRVVEETTSYLALAIANMAAMLDPEVVILSGGVAQSADLLLEPIERKLHGLIPFIPRVAASPLGRRAAVMGAISMVLDLVTGRVSIRRFA